MKYPKLWDGPTALGESYVRALEGLELPFAQIVTPGARAVKRNGFYEVYKGTVDPFLWGYYQTASGAEYAARLDPGSFYAGRENFKQSLIYGPGYNILATASSVYVGDNYVLQLLANQTNTQALNTVFWPALVRADGQGVEALSAAAAAHHSVSYHDTASLTGLGGIDGPSVGSAGHSFSLLATGWQDVVVRYRFSMTALYYSDPANPTTTRVPVVFTAGTGTFAIKQTAYPYYPGRDHLPFTAFTAGLGKIHALHLVTEDSTKPQIAPYLATSTNHGDSWAQVTATFLSALLYQHPIDGTHTRLYYDNSQLDSMGRYTTIIYMGNDTTLMIVPNVWVDGSLETTPAARFCPALFVGHGGSYLRQPWPGDTWYTDRNGLKTDPNGNAVLFKGVTLMRTARFATGLGRAFIPVFQAGAIRAMVTADYGQTWTFTPPVPAAIISPYTSCFCGVVTQARRDDAHPERVIFAAPNYASGKLSFLQTSDLLSTFKPVGAVGAKGLTSPQPYSSDANYCFVNYGGHRRKPAVFPAFPGEFDHP